MTGVRDSRHYIRTLRSGFENTRYHESLARQEAERARSTYIVKERRTRHRAGSLAVIFDVRERGGYTVAIFLPTLRTVLVFRARWKASSNWVSHAPLLRVCFHLRARARAPAAEIHLPQYV